MLDQLFLCLALLLSLVYFVGKSCQEPIKAFPVCVGQRLFSIVRLLEQIVEYAQLRCDELRIVQSLLVKRSLENVALSL